MRQHFEIDILSQYGVEDIADTETEEKSLLCQKKTPHFAMERFLKF
jgi:hypothetical protein